MRMNQIGAAESAIIESLMTITMRDGFQSSVVLDKPAFSPRYGSPLIGTCLVEAGFQVRRRP